jgi:hypothetical protein
MNADILHRLARHGALALAAIAGTAAASPALAQGQQAPERHVSVHPYLEVQQVLTTDFSGETLTYTGVGGGIDASIQTRRVVATLSYDYQHQISWKKGQGSGDVHTGLAAARLQLVPNVLALDAGAVATRTHGDVQRPVPGVRTDRSGNVSDVYSAYAGPTLSTHAGPLAVGADYHVGYVDVNDHGNRGVPAGTPRADDYDSSTVQQANASIGIDTHNSPVGITVGAGWAHEDMKRLDSKYDGKYVRGDVVVPLSSALAVTGGVGYEKIKSSQQDFLRDASGQPVVTADGNLVADPSRPRLLTYDKSGLIWDVGVIWRPGPRTELQARGGRRYGSTTVTGSFEHKFNDNYGISAFVYDNVSSFGRLLVADLNGVPRSFRQPRGGASIAGIGGLGGCVFGTQGGTGTCFSDALQSISNFNFRNRGGSVLLSGGRGPWSFGIGAGYNNRRYLAPNSALFALRGTTEQSFTVQVDVERRFTRTSGIDLDAYAGWYDSGLAGTSSSFGTGATATYYRSFLFDRLQADLSAGVYTVSGDKFDSTNGSLLLGLRYSF